MMDGESERVDWAVEHLDVKIVISDSHEGIKAAVAKAFKATWQR